ncbi:2-hydroxyacid dehydrogenase [Comamonas sp. SY3]|uniref:2-hydroxyacid dehydrogenase n=1 Tax=Comamonas sp. SY3 TaxID=3243601 RepID=UPI003592ED9A
MTAMPSTDAQAAAPGNAPGDTPRSIAFLSKSIAMDFLLPAYQAQFPGSRLLLGAELQALLDAGQHSDIEVAVCWHPPAAQLAQLTRDAGLQLVQSIAAGIDHIDTQALPASTPVCRIVDSTMGYGMTAFVSWAVIHRQRHMDRYVAHAAQRQWREEPIIAPSQHRVGIAGLGTLGQGCARALLAMGYQVRGWSRSAKQGLPAGLEGLQTFHGQAQKAEFLSGCDTLVCLLPLTDETQGFLDLALMRQLPRGAHLVNVGRGAHLVEADLLTALAEGQIGAATLDTFSTEPLPADHPFWQDPRILVTPHIATRTDPRVIARQTAHNFRRIRAGQAAEVAVDLGRGY